MFFDKKQSADAESRNVTVEPHVATVETVTASVPIDRIFEIVAARLVQHNNTPRQLRTLWVNQTT
jgi:hypothetical protein